MLVLKHSPPQKYIFSPQISLFVSQVLFRFSKENKRASFARRITICVVFFWGLFE